MTQAYQIGKPAYAVLAAGHQTSKKEIPLGQYFDDGKRRFRWAHIADSAGTRGKWVLQPFSSTSLNTILSAANQLKSATVAGQGGAAGDRIVALYGVSGLTDTRVFEDGYLVVYSGDNAGFVYEVDHYDVGGSGVTKLYLKEGLIAKISSTTYAKLRVNEYYGLRQSTYSKSCRIMGVLTNTLAASGYQLIQTRGFGIMKASSSVISAGVNVVPSVVDSGLVKNQSTTVVSGVTILGKAALTSAASGYFAAIIAIEP